MMEPQSSEEGSVVIPHRAAPASASASVQSTEAKHRRRRQRQQDEPRRSPKEEDGDGDGDDTKRSRRRARARRAEKAEASSGTRRGGSIMWTILMIGLVFSLVDVFYIIGFVERQNLIPVQDNQPFHRISQERPRPRTESDLTNTEEKSLSGNISGKDDRSDNGGDLDLLADKGRIMDLLTAAGIKVDLEEDKDLIQDLPTWSQVVNLYGPEPVIYGLEECDRFQHMSDPADHFVSTAGTFNTGTNLMAELLIANCHMQKRMDKYGKENRGVRWQVPWGKHTPPGDDVFRQSHKTMHDANVDANNILPAVTIRDPLVWLHSMCRHEYAANWDHPDKDHCPNFLLSNLEASVRYFNFTRQHKSILHLWNDYYQEYLQAPFPRLIVRFEDLVFHPEEVTRTVCECAGGSMSKDGKFHYVVNSAKKGENAHGKIRTGFVDAIVKYGTETRRYQNYRFRSDLEYVRDHADATVMRLMGYPAADPTKASEDS